MLIVIVIVIIIILLNIDSSRSFILPKLLSIDLLYNYIYKDRSDYINKYISDFLPNKQDTILNFGCGLNIYSDYLFNNGYKVIALDINDVSIAKHVKPHIYDGEIIPKDLEFDCVIVTTVLHHIPQDICENILKQLKSLNKQIIVLEDHYTSFITSLWCMITNLQFLNHPQNFKPYHEWKTLLSKYFNVKDIRIDTTACAFNLFPLKDNVYIQ